MEFECFPTVIVLFLISVPTNGLMVQIWLRKKNVQRNFNLFLCPKLIFWSCCALFQNSLLCAQTAWIFTLTYNSVHPETAQYFWGPMLPAGVQLQQPGIQPEEMDSVSQWDSLSVFYGLPVYSKFKILFYTFTKTLGQTFDIFSSPSPRFIISINHCCSSNRVPASGILSASALSSIIYLL